MPHLQDQSPIIKSLRQVVGDTAKFCTQTATYTGEVVGEDHLDMLDIESGLLKEGLIEVVMLSLIVSSNFARDFRAATWPEEAWLQPESTEREKEVT